MIAGVFFLIAVSKWFQCHSLFFIAKTTALDQFLELYFTDPVMLRDSDRG